MSLELSALGSKDFLTLTLLLALETNHLFVADVEISLLLKCL